MNIQQLINDLYACRNSQAEVEFVAACEVTIDSTDASATGKIEAIFKRVQITTDHPKKVKIWLS